MALTNLNLSELYKLKSINSNNLFEEHTYHNLAVIENNPVIENIPSELSVINEEESIVEKPPANVIDSTKNTEIVLEQQSDIIPLTE